ncbi:MAG TPA: peptide deformylase [bacterium]|nr:peptide deformylase [bacterium]HPS31163.1 peptide deformylase [bacterium]
MTVQKIKTAGDPVLKKKARIVTEINEKIKKLAIDMADTMKMAGGLGIAAPQVGVSLRLIVIDFGYLDFEKAESAGEKPKEAEFRPVAIINAEILEKNGLSSVSEGCLSVPGYRAAVDRAEKIKVKFTDIEGQEKIIEAEGLTAIAFQHEIDHTDGILFIDRISNLKRSIAIKKVKKFLEDIEEDEDKVEITLYGKS